MIFMKQWAGRGAIVVCDIIYWSANVREKNVKCILIIIIIIEGLSLLQSIPPTTADKQTQAQKRRRSRARKLLGAKAKSYRQKKCILMTSNLTKCVVCGVLSS